MTPDEADIKMRVESHTTLLTAIVKTYGKPWIRKDELLKAGEKGLRYAAERYDPEKGYRFSTFATFWIRRYIESAMGK